VKESKHGLPAGNPTERESLRLILQRLGFQLRQVEEEPEAFLHNALDPLDPDADDFLRLL